VENIADKLLRHLETREESNAGKTTGPACVEVKYSIAAEMFFSLNLFIHDDACQVELGGAKCRQVVAVIEATKVTPRSLLLRSSTSDTQVRCIIPGDSKAVDLRKPR